MTNTTQLSSAMQTAFNFIASGKPWEVFALETYGADHAPPRLATYQALRVRGLITVGAAGSYVVA